MPTRPGSPRNVAATIRRIKLLDAGVQKHLTPTTKVLIAGTLMTQERFRKQLAGYLAVFKDVEDAKAVLKSKLAARAKALPSIEEGLATQTQAFRNQFGARHVALSDFGIPLKRAKRKLTPIEQAIAVANWQASRKARGTMGPKERRAVTVAGRPGVAIVDPTGRPLPGGRPPVPPRTK